MFRIDYVEFKRAVFFARGYVNKNVKKDYFFLKEYGSNFVIPINNVKFRDNEFEIEFHTLAINNESPLYTGNWYLCTRDTNDNDIMATVSDDLYDKIYQYKIPDTELDVIIDKSANNYFHVFSRLNDKNFIYYLQVEYCLPEVTNNIIFIWLKNIRRRHKSRLRLIRKFVFSSFFSVMNKIVKKNGKRVLFTSDSRKEISGNEKFIYARMLERGMDKEYEIRFNYKNGIGAYRHFKDKFLFTYYLATSDYIFLDDYQPEIYLNEYDDNVKVIQVWHACGAFKTLGLERMKGKGAPAFNTKVHKCYTHVPVSSEHSIKHHAEAFGIDEKKFYPVGIPRTDIFFDLKYREKIKNKIYNEFTDLKSKSKILLYAPTFRGENANNAYFPMHVLHLKKIGECLRKINGIMIIKLHPFVKSKLVIPDEYKSYFIDASEQREINDILFVIDLLITDYSSVIYETALLNKPMLFYAFDLKQYEKERGFYEPYEDIVPGKIVKTIPALIKALEEEDYEAEKLEGFITKNFKYLDGKATDRVIDLVFNNKGN